MHYSFLPSSVGSLAIALLSVLGLFALQLEANGVEPVLIYRVHPKKCPHLAEPPSLSFVQEEAPRLVHLNQSSPFGCKRAVECKVLTSPSESNVYWYHNNQLLQASTIRDITLNAIAARSSESAPTLLGLSQMTHRLCVDPFLSSTQPEEFKCKIQSLCELNETIESGPIIVRPSVGAPRARGTPLRRTSQVKAPLITMIQSTRMEMAGNFVQLMCNAVGNPKPLIEWSVLDEEDESLAYPLQKFPFIWELADGGLLVDSARTELASISFEVIIF